MAFTIAEAFAPASMGNVGIGFDILGLAFAEPGDIVRAEWRDAPGAVMLRIEGDNGLLPLDPAKNTACVAANHVLHTLQAKRGVGLTLFKHLPLASGLGSSAASAVAAAVAVNALLGSPLGMSELLPACLAGEACVSGYHADNVAPSLLGGIVLVEGTDASSIRHLPVPARLHLGLFTPAIEVPTAEARAVLPDVVPLKAVVRQTAGVAAFVDALHRGDIAAMGQAMEQDHIIEPARRQLIPHLEAARRTARQVGAYGVVISGAGPTLCAVCDDADVAKVAAQAMQDVYDDAGIAGVAYSTTVGMHGARVIALE